MPLEAPNLPLEGVSSIFVWKCTHKNENGFKWLNWGLEEVATKVLNKRKGDYIYEEQNF